jgi:hypothetical protein
VRQAHQLKPSPGPPLSTRTLYPLAGDDPESQIGQLLGLAEADPFELDPLRGLAAEQADALAE